MPEVRWVQSSWAGVTPLLDLGRTDYLLTGVKDTFGSQMAEYVLGYLLANELKIFERLGRQANRCWWDESSGTLEGKDPGDHGYGVHRQRYCQDGETLWHAHYRVQSQRRFGGRFRKGICRQSA